MNLKVKRTLVYAAVLFLCLSVIVVIVIIVVKLMTNSAFNNLKNDRSFHQEKNPEWYRGTGNFPEAAFPVAPEYKDAYSTLVKDGFVEMKEKRIVISGLARDIKPQLKKTLNFMLNDVGPRFKDFVIVVYENDSKDGTREYLEKMEKRYPGKVVLVPCDVPRCVHVGAEVENSGLSRYIAEQKMKKQNKKGDVKVQSPKSKKSVETAAAHHGLYAVKRFWKMSYFRNTLNAFVAQNYSDFDFCMSFDWDIKGAISLDGMATCFGYLKQGYYWDAISAMGLCGAPFDKSGTKLSYYDTLAYQPFGKKMLKPTYLGSVIFTSKVHSMLIPPRGTPPIQVSSAFGGCAIYQMKAIVDPRHVYSGDICEHLSFHQRMVESGMDKIFINPSFVMLHTVALAPNVESPFERFVFSTIR